MANTKEPVPELTSTNPAPTTPNPIAAHCWSPPAAITGIPSVKPSSPEATWLTTPMIEPGGTTSGNLFKSMPTISIKS